MFGLLVLGDPVGWRVMTGIAVSLVGVLLLSNRVRLKDVLQADRAVLLGLVSGAAFAVAIVSFRGASLALPSGDYLIRAALTLAVAVSMQSLIMGAYLGLFEAGELRRVVRAWRPASVVGLTGMLASAGWFTAVTLESAALVRAVGQVELLFTFAASIWFFGERVGWRESAGVVLVVIGIWVLL